jgi:hypothetical protein
LGSITHADGTKQRLYGFVLTLGHSRAMFADIACDQKLPTFLRLHEAAFEYLGGVPQEILYDRVKTVVLGIDERGETKWQAVFADFAGYWGFTPRLCRPYRPQTKGKVESGIGYLRKNFLCGRDATDLGDLRCQLQTWAEQVANRRVHGTTHKSVAEAWEQEKPHLQQVVARPVYPLMVEQIRRVSRDAFVSFGANRYSVPWQAVGKEVLVRQNGEMLEIWRDGQLLARHAHCASRHQVLLLPAHHQGIPAGSATRRGKVRLCLRVTAPQVEVRSLSVYAAVAEREGGA